MGGYRPYRPYRPGARTLSSHHCIKPVPSPQNHPLQHTDRAVVDRLLKSATPSDQDLVDAARLLNRYDGFPGARDIPANLIAAAKSWGFTNRAELNARVRSIWQSGFRPSLSNDEVGSGADLGPVVKAAALASA